MDLFYQKKRDIDTTPLNSILEDISYLESTLSNENLRQVSLQLSKSVKSLLSLLLDIDHNITYEEFIIYVKKLDNIIKELDNEIIKTENDISKEYSKNKKDKEARENIDKLKKELKDKTSKRDYAEYLYNIFNQKNFRNTLFKVLKKLIKIEYSNNKIKLNELKDTIKDISFIAHYFTKEDKTHKKNIVQSTKRNLKNKLLLSINNLHNKEKIILKIKTKLNNLIGNLKILLNNNNRRAARKVYIKILSLYKKLPNKEKAEFYDRIMEEYNKLVKILSVKKPQVTDR